METAVLQSDASTSNTLKVSKHLPTLPLSGTETLPFNELQRRALTGIQSDTAVG